METAAVSRSVVGKSAIAIVAGLLSVLAEANPPSADSGNQSPGAVSPSQEPRSSAPQVTIQGQSQQDLEHRAHDFVQKLVRGGRFYGESLPTWHKPLCFEVLGLPRPQGEFVLSRLSSDASSAGIRLAGDPCQPNFFVILTSQPDSLIETLNARRPKMFGNGQSAQIRRFLHPSNRRVVRVWYNADSIGTDGMPMIRLGTACGGVPMSWMTNEIPTNCEHLGSHLQLSALIAFSSVVIVVDSNLSRDATFGQLSDYIAMVGMADIDPDGDYGDIPTILHLFNQSQTPAPPGLTTWDQAFLSAIYGTDQASSTQ